MLKRLQPRASIILQQFGHKGSDIMASNRAKRFEWKHREGLPFLPPGTSEQAVAGKYWEAEGVWIPRPPKSGRKAYSKRNKL